MATECNESSKRSYGWSGLGISKSDDFTFRKAYDCWVCGLPSYDGVDSNVFAVGGDYIY